MWMLLLTCAALAEPYWVDADGDGYGDPAGAIESPSTTPPLGYVGNDQDCNDGDADVRPGVDDPCDAVDNDCDGLVDGDGVCPCPTDYRDDHAYLFCPTPTPWTAARDFCNGYGYHLVSVATAAENDWVDDTADTYSTQKWWFGLTDAAQEGVWVWDDGSDLVYSNWHAGEPNDAGGGEDCVQFNRFHPDRTWNDEPCSSSFRFICENAPLRTWFWDGDGDGWGDSSVTFVASDELPGWVEVGGDCNDNNPNRFPDNPDLCDGLDNDCDGLVDGGPSNPPMYVDGDDDGFGAGAVIAHSCVTDEDVSDATDCNDSDASIHPGALEFCDGVDEDCNGLIDDNPVDATTSWDDGDLDGFGDPDSFDHGCDHDPENVDNDLDCDDDRPEAFPSAPELCNGLDDDCDGVADNDPIDQEVYWRDADGDGYGDPGAAVLSCTQPSGHRTPGEPDCDDTDSTVHPGAFDVPSDGIDQDCDGMDAQLPGDTADTGDSAQPQDTGDSGDSAAPVPDIVDTSDSGVADSPVTGPLQQGGQLPEVWSGGGCACSSSGAPSWPGWLLALVLLTARRRVLKH